VIWVARIACSGVIGRMETTERAGEAAGRLARPARPVHRDVDALLDVADRQPLGLERALEGERAADQEGDEVVAPVLARVGRLVGDLAVAEDPVARDVGAEVGAGRDPRRFGRARIGDVEHRARLGVGDAEAQEVEGVGLRQRDEVGLRCSRGEAGRRPGVVARAGRRSQPCGV
jgi:hypothetical protein